MSHLSVSSQSRRPSYTDCTAGDNRGQQSLFHRSSILSLPRTVSNTVSWIERPISTRITCGPSELSRKDNTLSAGDEGAGDYDNGADGDLDAAAAILGSVAAMPNSSLSPSSPTYDAMARFIRDVHPDSLPPDLQYMEVPFGPLNHKEQLLTADPWRALDEEMRGGLLPGGEFARVVPKQELQEIIARTSGVNHRDKPLPSVPQDVEEEDDSWATVSLQSNPQPLSPRSPIMLIDLQEARSRFAHAHCLDLLPPMTPTDKHSVYSTPPRTPVSPHPTVMLSPLISLDEARSRFSQPHPRDLSPTRRLTVVPGQSLPRKRSRSHSRAVLKARVHGNVCSTIIV